MPLNIISALHSVRRQLYHLSAIFITGIDLFTDAYVLFSIPLVSNLLGSIYYHNEMPIHVKALVNGITLCGASQANSSSVGLETEWLHKSHRDGFLAIYSLTFFFANFGPNTTTFIVPAELFAARLRLTCHGISAAAGKAGAIIGAFGFLYASQPRHTGPNDCDRSYPRGIGVDKALIILGVASCVGFFCTYLIPETRGRSLVANEVDLAQIHPGVEITQIQA